MKKIRNLYESIPLFSKSLIPYGVDKILCNNYGIKIVAINNNFLDIAGGRGQEAGGRR
jgi:hypothetical protein